MAESRGCTHLPSLPSAHHLLRCTLFSPRCQGTQHRAGKGNENSPQSCDELLKPVANSWLREPQEQSSPRTFMAREAEASAALHSSGHRV